MYIALGFALATLLATAAFPVIYRRAVRLTKEAVLAVNPTSYAEVRAAQDFERATHALALRQAEAALEREREHSVKHRLETGRLTAEAVKLKAKFGKEVAELKTALEEAKAASGGRKAKSKALAAELTQTQAKLADAEKALAEHDKTTIQTDLQQVDPLVQTTIAGLELQVATLKAQLEKTEGKTPVTDPLLLTDADDLRRIISRLEAELVDAETRYISAQAEVTRLSVASEQSEASVDDQLAQAQRDRKWADEENARLSALLRDRERTLKMAKDQVASLRSDLSAALQSSATSLDALDDKSTLASTTDQATDKTAPTAASPETRENVPVMDASALVSRIVRSSNAARKKQPPAPAKDDVGADPKVSQTASASAGQGPNSTSSSRTKTSRTKKRDVA
ncbi:hypothetical protein [Roseibium sp.]|uniref:hypothetical protein n=1 Tax=Roseibium sp. TaxID=1936156 RepID=UPI003A970F1C